MKSMDAAYSPTSGLIGTQKCHEFVNALQEILVLRQVYSSSSQFILDSRHHRVQEYWFSMQCTPLQCFPHVHKI